MPGVGDRAARGGGASDLSAAATQGGGLDMSDYQTTRLVIGLQAEIEGLRREIEGHGREIGELRRDVRDMRDVANRWRGGFAVIVGLGAACGWLLTQVDRIRSWLS